MISLLRRSAGRAGRALGSRVGRMVGLGALLGGCLPACWHQFVSTLGGSVPATTAALLATALAVDLGLRRSRGASRRQGCESVAPPSGWLPLASSLAAWTACLPLVLKGVAAAFALIPIETLSAGWGSALAYGLAAAAVFGAPGWLLGRGLRFAGEASTRGAAGFASGLAIGGGLFVFCAAPLFGAAIASTLLASAAFAWCALDAVFRRGSLRNDAARSMPHVPAAGSPTADAAVPTDGSPARATPWSAVVALPAIGLCLGVMSRAVAQLMPATAFVVHAEWIAVVLAAAWSAARATRRGGDRDSRRSPAIFGGLLATGWTAVVLAAFPLLVETCLTLTLWTPTSWLLVVVRSCVAAGLFAPLGFGLGRCVAASRAIPALTLTLLGAVSASWLIPAAGMAMPVVALAAGFGVASVAAMAVSRTWPAAWLARGASGALASSLVAACCFAPGYDPSSPARLLFSTNVLVARQMGVERRLLPVLDETRLVAVREGTTGTFTLWKSRGAQLLLRENGVPRGALCADPAVAPQLSADLMPGVLPLALHEAPHRVLLLGAGGGLPALAALASPVQQVLCIEPDAAAVSLLAGSMWPAGERSPTLDDRLVVRAVDPVAAVACNVGEWDVVVSSPRQSALAGATGEFTAEFYRNAAKRLAADGIFCQRFSHVDYGPQPILVVASTLQTAFREVAAIEAGPGELLFLATNSEAGLVRGGLVERLQRPHVRELLSQAGWDWSMPLNLAAFNHDSLATLAAARGANPQTASQATFAFRLPQELMRSAAKWQEVVQAMQPSSSRLLAWPAVDANDPDLLARLGEVAGQRNLMTAYPDQPWAYRKSLREQLSKSNRSVIRPVSGSGLDRDMHPDDRHRMRYFEALGRATRGKETTPDDVAALAEFAAPFDPLVTHFVHSEVANLYERLPEPRPEAELRHRLYVAWHSDVRDRSVRDVVRALELINGESVPLSTEDRWDQTNGLLQQLAVRWGNRGMVKPASTQVVLNDIELSLAAGEAALDNLAKLAPEMGIAAADVEARKRVVERSLIRPLRTYRTRLLPIQFNKDRAKREAEEGLSAGDAG